jgi:flagellar protein FlaG
MAAESSFTHMLFFIAAIVVAVSVAGVLIGVSNSMANEIRLKSDSLASEMGTEITIINDPRQVPYSNGTLTLYLKNTGDITLNYNGIGIFIDGQYLDGLAITSEEGSPYWQPTHTLELQVTVALEPGDHMAKVVMPNGVSDTMAFRI